MGALTLHPMKEIRVIVAGEHQAFVTELLDQVNATGYTIIGNVSGKGHHGVHEAHFMFSEQESLEMIMTARLGRKSGAHPGGASDALRTPLRRDVRQRRGRQSARVFRQAAEQFMTRAGADYRYRRVETSVPRRDWSNVAERFRHSIGTHRVVLDFCSGEFCLYDPM